MGKSWLQSLDYGWADGQLAALVPNNTRVTTTSSSVAVAPVDQGLHGHTRVYNLFAEATHTYFVGKEGLLVHSCVGMNIFLNTALERGKSAAIEPIHRQGRTLSPDAAFSAALGLAVVLDSLGPAVGVLDGRQMRHADGLLRLGSLACLPMGDWVDFVGEWLGTMLVLLDHKQGRLNVLSKAGLAAAIQSSGDVQCVREDIIIASIVLLGWQEENMPFRGSLGLTGDVYLTYTGADLVEHVRLHQNGSYAGGNLFRLPSRNDQRSGASGVALCGQLRQHLCVTHVAWNTENPLEVCFLVSSTCNAPRGTCVIYSCNTPCGTCMIAAANLPQHTFGAGSIFVLQIDSKNGSIMGVDTVIASLPLSNPIGLHRHSDSNGLYVIYAGDRQDLPGGFQRLLETNDGRVTLGVVISAISRDATYIFVVINSLFVLCYQGYSTINL